MCKLSRCAVAAVLLSPFTTGQDSRDAMGILKKVAETYKNLTTYDIEQVESQHHQSAEGASQSERRERLAGAPGRKIRSERVGGVVDISDGHSSWRYNPANDEYTKTTGSLVSRIQEYERIAEPVQSARVLREEPVLLQTGPVQCFVVEAELKCPTRTAPEIEIRPITYWIDKTRYLVLKDRQGRVVKAAGRGSREWVITRSVTKIDVGEPLPDSLFEFDPQVGAVQVEQLSFRPRSPLLGKLLPDFEWKDQAGNVVTPASLRGRLAVLGFSMYLHTEGLSFLELVHRVFKDKGVAVVAVVTHEDRLGERIAPLGYSMPTAAVPVSITTTVGIGRNFPLVVLLIDASGKVIYDSNGSSLDEIERQIVKTLRQTGIW